MEVCPTCMGKGKVQPTLLFTDQVQEEIEHFAEHFGKQLRLHLHPFVYSYATRGLFGSLASQWRRKFGVRVIENQSLGMLETRFFDAQGNPLQLPKEEKKDEKKAGKQEEKQTAPAEEQKEPPKAAPAASKKETTKKAAPATTSKKETTKAAPKEPKKAEKAEPAEPKKAEKKTNKAKQPNPQNGEK